MVPAHTAVGQHGPVEPQMLAFGVVMLFLAVMLRPSKSGSRQQFIVALVAGAGLVIASILVPRFA